MPQLTPNTANAARACFNHNKNLNKVFVTADGACFAQRNHAINHARTLDPKTIDVFERSEEAVEESKKLKVKSEKELEAESGLKTTGVKNKEQRAKTVKSEEK